VFWPTGEFINPTTEQHYCQKSISINASLYHCMLLQDKHCRKIRQRIEHNRNITALRREQTSVAPHEVLEGSPYSFIRSSYREQVCF